MYVCITYVYIYACIIVICHIIILIWSFMHRYSLALSPHQLKYQSFLFKIFDLSSNSDCSTLFSSL